MRTHNDIKWHKDGDSWQLLHGNKHLISMDAVNRGSRNFTIEQNSFSIGYKSLLSNKWFVKGKQDQEILALKFGFWNSIGIVTFADGSVFECTFSNAPNFNLKITDARYGDHLLTYEICDETDNAQKKLTIHQPEFFTHKLLFLITLGMCLTLHYYQQDLDLGTFLTLFSA